MSVRVIHWETWALAEEADRRFRRILATVGAPALLLALLITIFQLELPKVEPPPFTPPPVIQLIKPKQPAPVAPPVQQPQPKPVQKVQEKAAPAKVEKPKPAPKPAPSARELAQKTKEFQTIQDQLADLRDQNLNTITSEQPLVSGVVTSRGGVPTNGGDIASGAAQTSGLGSVGGGSVTGQIGGTGLGSRHTGAVSSPMGGKGGLGESYANGRSLTEIQEVFDRNKRDFISIFNRAQRDNTNISDGTISVRLNIAPDGSVTECTIVGSTFNDPDFERRVRDRVMALHFRPKSVPPFIVASYPIQFHPM
jgi:outer membrane biosynthesis protein TonB